MKQLASYLIGILRRNKYSICYFLLLLPGTIAIICGMDAHKVGFYTNSNLITHLIYPFFHANILHLAFNVYCLGIIINALHRAEAINIIHSFVASYIIGIACSYISEYSLPTIGLSGLIYSLIGMYTYLRLMNSGKWTILAVILLNGIAYFVGTTNVLIHITCFVGGFLYAALWDLFYIIKYLRNERRRDD